MVYTDDMVYAVDMVYTADMVHTVEYFQIDCHPRGDERAEGIKGREGAEGIKGDEGAEGAEGTEQSSQLDCDIHSKERRPPWAWKYMGDST